MINKCNVVRIHLKTSTEVGREKLIDFCLHDKTEQYVAIGWSCAHDDASYDINTFEDYYRAVREWSDKRRERLNTVVNKFRDTKENDLFWTRDLDGIYWICRAKGAAEPYYNYSLDIGARVPVEAYKYGMEVPGQIKASFTRNGGTAAAFYDKQIIEFSKHTFNLLSNRDVYTVSKIKDGNILENIPDFDLEELVISYIQIKDGYYVLSNSIARKSTTIKIECEFRSRDKNNPKRAVVQVKGGHNTEIDAMEYKGFDDDGYDVYFFAPVVKNLDVLKNGIWIKRDELLKFYQEFKAVLPDSITKWESLFE